MAGRAEFLYSELKDRAAIDGLIGEPEDGHLDCKEWPAKEKDAHEMLAKAVCGLTNSDGGVLVIGMRAKSQRSGAPDVITDFAPVPDTSQIRSRILTLVGNLVEPPIVGVETREIGRNLDQQPMRTFALGLRNSGVGIAKFPGVVFSQSVGLSVDPYGIDGNANFGVRRRPSEGTQIIFGGGVDDVIYPGQTVMIARLQQKGANVGLQGIPVGVQVIAHNREIKARYVFKQIHFWCEISCEGCKTETVFKVIPEADSIIDI